MKVHIKLKSNESGQVIIDFGSNADFDRSLRARNPKWGIRDIEDVASLAEAHGLKLTETIDMPANNLSLVLEKT